jgi:hypothetical protein
MPLPGVDRRHATRRDACSSPTRGVTVVMRLAGILLANWIGPHACFRWVPAPRSPIYGKTLASGPRAVYPLDF